MLGPWLWSVVVAGPPPCTQAADGAGLVINELLPNPPGADAGGEWVELFHGGDTMVAMDGWAVQAGTQSLADRVVLEGVLAPGEHWLVGGDRVLAVDQQAELGLGNAGRNADAVRLVDCTGDPVDTVVYGSPNDGDPPICGRRGPGRGEPGPRTRRGRVLAAGRRWIRYRFQRRGLRSDR